MCVQEPLTLHSWNVAYHTKGRVVLLSIHFLPLRLCTTGMWPSKRLPKRQCGLWAEKDSPLDITLCSTTLGENLTFISKLLLPHCEKKSCFKIMTLENNSYYSAEVLSLSW